MFEGAKAVVLISPTIGLVALMVGIYVYRKNPFMPPARSFLLVMFLLFVFGFVDLAFRTAPDPESALVFGRLAFFFITLFFAGVLYLASYLPYEKYSGWFTRSYREYIVIALLSALLAAVDMHDLRHFDYGWAMQISEGLAIWALVVVSYIVITVYMLAVTCMRSDNKSIRAQCTIMSVGVLSPLLYIFTILGLLALGVAVPEVYFPGTIFLVIVFAFAVLRLRLFVESPKKDLTTSEPSGKGVASEGRFVLIEEKKPDKAYSMFIGMANAGSPSMLMTRTHPDIAREEFKLTETIVIWLSAQVGTDRLDPSNLSIMQHTITEFLHKKSGAVVMLDGIEYLFSNNPPDRVVRMIQSVRDEVIISEASFLIPLNPETVDIRHLSMFEREFEVMKLEKGAGTEI